MNAREPIVQARGLEQVYTIRRGMFKPPAKLQAVGGVSFDVRAGQTLAVVGESVTVTLADEVSSAGVFRIHFGPALVGEVSPTGVLFVWCIWRR